LSNEIPHRDLERGLALFNAGEYFQAHEYWEDWWRESSQPEKLTVQAIVQVAVAMHHSSTGNVIGAQSVMQRALRNLTDAPRKFHGLDVNRLRSDMQLALDRLETGEPATRFEIARDLSGDG
jgi:predicted metal-dependent hydrolase